MSCRNHWLRPFIPIFEHKHQVLRTFDCPVLEVAVRIEKAINQGDYIYVRDFEKTDFLTPKEEEIMQLISQGHKQEVVALELGISRKTVQNHLTNIAHKFDTTSQLESVLRAIALGIIDVNYEIINEF